MHSQSEIQDCFGASSAFAKYDTQPKSGQKVAPPSVESPNVAKITLINRSSFADGGGSFYPHFG